MPSCEKIFYWTAMWCLVSLFQLEISLSIGNFDQRKLYQRKNKTGRFNSTMCILELYRIRHFDLIWNFTTFYQPTLHCVQWNLRKPISTYQCTDIGGLYFSTQEQRSQHSHLYITMPNVHHCSRKTVFNCDLWKRTLDGAVSRFHNQPKDLCIFSLCT